MTKVGSCVNVADLVKVTESRDFFNYKRLVRNFDPVKCPAEFMAVLWSLSCFNDLRSLSSLSTHLINTTQLSTEDKLYALHYYDRCGLRNSVSTLQADVVNDFTRLVSSSSVDTLSLLTPLAIKSISSRPELAEALIQRVCNMSLSDVDQLLRDEAVAKSMVVAVSQSSDGLSQLPPPIADLIISTFIHSANSLEIQTILQFISKVVELQSPLSHTSVIKACERRLVSLAPATLPLKDLALICHCFSDVLAVEPRRSILLKYARDVMREILVRRNEFVEVGCKPLVEGSLIDFTAIFRLFREARIVSRDVLFLASEMLSDEIPLHVTFRLLKYSNKVRWFEISMFEKLATFKLKPLEEFGARGLNLVGPICFFLAFAGFKDFSLANKISSLLTNVHAIEALVKELDDTSLNTTMLMLIWSSIVMGGEVPTAGALVDALAGRLDTRKITVNLLSDINAFIGRANFLPLSETWMNAQCPLDVRIPEAVLTRDESCGFACFAGNVIIPESMGFLDLNEGGRVRPPAYLSLAVSRSLDPWRSFISESDVLQKLGIT